MTTHFCTCTDHACSMHPRNHSHGCDPCIRSNLLKKEMPSCFFLAVRDGMDKNTDTSFAGFVDYFLRHRDDSREINGGT